MDHLPQSHTLYDIWSAPQNGLWTSGYPLFYSIFGSTYSRSVRLSVEQKGRDSLCMLGSPLALLGNPLKVDWFRGLLYM